MASIDEVMSHRNRDPKWMTDSIQTEEVLKKKNKDPTWMTGSNEKQASQPQAPKAPKASAIPQMNFKVHMCCDKCVEKAKEEAGEVPGVVSVITDARQGLVTVLGGADPAAVLKKLKRHVDKKATYWPAEVPVPKVAVTPNVSAGGMNLGKGERNLQIGEKGGRKGGYVDKDLRGPGMDDPRRVQTMMPDPRMVDPRMAERMRPDPRMVDPRIAETMRPDPRMVDLRMVDARETRGGDRREMPIDPREMRNAEVREGWVVDPRERRGGDMRGMRPVDPREMRNAEVREGWVVDPREMRGGGMTERRGAEMREMRPLDPRMVDPREVGGVHVREMKQPIGAREMGEYQYAQANRREMYPVDPQTFDIRGGDPRDYRFSNPRTMHAPPPELYYNSRSQEADPRVFQPKESYFSDYRPSQSYPANYSNSASYNDEDDMSPYYMNQAVY